VDRARLDRIGEVIAALDPDIVALQEVPLMTVDGLVTDMAADVGSRLGVDGRYGGVHHLPVVEPEGATTIGTYTWGNALLSRLPIVSSQTVALPIPADDDEVEPGGSRDELAGVRYRDVEPGMREARCALVCALATGSGTVHAISTHLTYIGSSQRRRQAEALAGLVESLAGPVILGGDLNAPIHAPELGPLRGPLVDAFMATGVPPVDERRLSCGDVAIDHVLVRGLRPVTCRVVTEAGPASDHWPVVATVVA
jgi:endonuclease/exonuclease/phosphatase family metal-dependent hydrolase